ncbi:hypothetical protein HDU67_006271 [Dinochytrium kinnereticum]|nr:hypothetical protein HDU67_006271 [Dinochytrium kinnereticum]
MTHPSSASAAGHDADDDGDASGTLVAPPALPSTTSRHSPVPAVHASTTAVLPSHPAASSKLPSDCSILADAFREMRISRSDCCLWTRIKCDDQHHIVELASELPESLSKLSHLTDLLVSNNALTGKIPASLAALPSLKNLWLSNNLFTGPLPTTLSPSILQFHVNDNLLSGVVPEELTNLQGV